MTTGSFQNWAGNIADIGAIYPFVGSETLLWIIAVVLWIVWHVVQAKRENNAYRDQIARFGKPETLSKLIDEHGSSNS